MLVQFVWFHKKIMENRESQAMKNFSCKLCLRMLIFLNQRLPNCVPRNLRVPYMNFKDFANQNYNTI